MAMFALLSLSSASARPNILWLHVESTDGRLYNADSPVPIPNIRAVQSTGVNFDNAYANIPICCPSRASVWTFNGIEVIGAISNYEGLGVENSTWDLRKMNNLLASAGYEVQIGGKEDWLSGGHSLTTMVDSWSIYARFPYDIPGHAGNHIWGSCGGNLSVLAGNESAHKGDWKVVASQTAWLQQRGSDDTRKRPFFMYGGFSIVHPPYATNEHYLARIDQSRIAVPEWEPIEDLHPCDLGVSMKKGCAVSQQWNARTPEHPHGTGFIDTDAHPENTASTHSTRTPPRVAPSDRAPPLRPARVRAEETGEQRARRHTRVTTRCPAVGGCGDLASTTPHHARTDKATEEKSTKESETSVPAARAATRLSSW